MPEGSVAYANMRRALLAEVARIPHGHVVEATVLGEALNIPARYVGSILARLRPDGPDAVPWHRVIPKGGSFPKSAQPRPRVAQQLQRLAQEGHQVHQARLMLDVRRLWTPAGTHRHTFWADVEPD